MSFGHTLIINLSILAAIVFSDWGRKAVSWERLVRPLVICAIVVPLFVHGIPTIGNDVELQLAGIAAGVVVGIVAVSLAKVDHVTGDGEPATTTGPFYAGVWIAVSVARIAFAWGSKHWFAHSLATFSLQHRLTSQGITNALVFMAVIAAVVRVLAIGARVVLDRRNRGGRRMPVSARTAKRALPVGESSGG